MRDLIDINFVTITGREEVAFGSEVFRDKSHLAQVLERREKLAGRKLTNNELAQGVVQDHRSAPEKIRAGHGELMTFQNDTEPNVYKSRGLQEYIEHVERPLTLGKVDRRELYGNAAAEKDKQLVAEAAAEAKHNQPERVKLRTAAAEALEFARFSRDSNVDILYAALRLVESTERDDDLTESKKAYSTIIDDLRANAAIRRAEIDSQIELVKQRAEFDPEPQGAQS